MRRPTTPGVPDAPRAEVVPRRWEAAGSPVDRSRSVLLEVDFQPWVLGLAHDPTCVLQARAVREELRAERARILCSRYLGDDVHGVDRSSPDDPGARFLQELAPSIDDVVLSKHGVDIFANPDLIANLHAWGTERLTLTGLLTDGGVLAAAESGIASGFDVTVVAGACAGSSRAAHDAACSRMAKFGVRVL